MALLDHAGQHRLGDDERAGEVDVDDLTVVGGAHLEHRDALDDTGVVDQDVRRGAKVALDLLDEVGDLVLLGDVGDVALGLYALLGVVGETLVDLVLVAVVEGDLGAGLGESRREGEADAVAGTRHERDLAVEAEAVHVEDARICILLCHANLLVGLGCVAVEPARMARN